MKAQHIGAMGRVAAALVLIGLAAPCRGGPPRDEKTPAAESPPAPAPRARDTGLRVAFTVENRSGKPMNAAIVQGGIPFVSGVLRDPAPLLVHSADGSPVPAQARPLAFWDDGSVKWASVTCQVADLPPAVKATFTITDGGERDAFAQLAPTGSMPAGVRFSLVDQAGSARFASDSNTLVEAGPLMVERTFGGTFEGRKGTVDAGITVASFPGIDAVRYRFDVKQLENGAEWKSLSAIVPHPRVFVYQQEEMGARVHRSASGATEVVFIDSREPVDLGVGRRWEVWGFDADSRAAGRVLRPVVEPSYLIETGAMGDIAEDVPARWQTTFEKSVESVFARRDANPRNFGWRHYGDFFDREHGLAYHGYLDQEYDPSTALWLAYARTGNLDFFDRAESLADFFRDMCISPEGGTYQHRATIHAAYANIVYTISSNLESRIRSAPGYGQTTAGLVTAIGSTYGDKTGRGAKKILDAMPASEPFRAKERRLIHQLANSVVKSEEERLKKKVEGRSQEEVDRITLRDMMGFYAQSDDMRQLGYGDVDAAFAPFFRRYGGSWDDFPAFHVDILPDPTKAHTGSHSLLEMLVWAYVMTGDEAYREVALRAARYHIDTLIPFVIDTYGGVLSQQKPVESRNAAWPLVNMMAVWEMTEGRDPELNREVRGAAASLAELLMRIRVEQHQGSIHTGIVLEALCRYHRKTRDARASRYIVELAHYWSAKQWSGGKRAFNINANDPGSADASMTGLLLYGLAYANQLSPDGRLQKRIQEAARGLEEESTNYAKRFAQLYRSTPRAFALIAADSR